MKSAGRHRLDLAPQAAQRLAVDARQNAPMTKLMIRAGEIPAQDQAFAFELRQRNLDIAQPANSVAPPDPRP